MDSSREDSRIESYLASVDASMGKVPTDRREALLMELREHMEKLIEDYEAAGRSKLDAVDGALSMMGPARKLGRQYARMWYRSTEPGSVLAALGLMTVVDSCVSALQMPIAVAVSVHSIHLSAVMIGGLIVLALLRSSAGLVAGWITPRGAVKAAVIGGALGLAALLVKLMNPNISFGPGLVELSLIPAGLNVCGAVVASRLRMRKMAGI